MSAGASLALALVRVPRGEPQPPEETFRDAVEEDRKRLHLPPRRAADLEITGPYPIFVDGTEMDEYVVWEK